MPSDNNFRKIKAALKLSSVIGFGADLKAAFSFSRGGEILLSPAFGDLAGPENNERFKGAVYRSAPKGLKVAACDLHPAYYSTQIAEEFSLQKKIPLKRVQHHHAHIAACCLENNFFKPVLGVSFDGTGFGSDGAVWGGEFLLVDKSGFKRLAHLDYVDLPGGDLAAKEPWRMGLVYLRKAFGDKFWNLKIDFVKNLNKNKGRLILEMIDKNINNYKTSSIGRLFDAVAAIAGVCQINKFEAQAPQLLEKISSRDISESYNFDFSDGAIDSKPLIRDIVKDILAKEDKGFISAKFHNTICSMVLEAAKKFKIKTVALSGGVFLNKILSKKIPQLLERDGFKVLTHKISPSDATIALGQVWIAAR